jgi:hypothetical protein
MRYFEEGKQKGTIELTKQTRCERKSPMHFEIITEARTWFLYAKDEAAEVDAWIREIQGVIAEI